LFNSHRHRSSPACIPLTLSPHRISYHCTAVIFRPSPALRVHPHNTVPGQRWQWQPVRPGGTTRRCAGGS
jgi:hypothetical protein